ncbi:DUF4145 domain-containing protein [Streptomyces sp. NPDC059568]|uniref:DUF4145 domain-containing protein n=1 Tax=Streptomyces sp. NPDC059568 TaxID=3346868 RepID=UPI0036A26F8C
MASTICGWCGDRTHMAMVLDPYPLPQATWPQQLNDRPVWMAAFRCSNEKCHRLSIGWSVLYQVKHASTAKDQLPSGDLEWEPLSIRRPAFLDVPPEIAETASEAHACLSIGAARGAVALARSVVEATAKAKGITVNGIVAKINALRDRGVISTLTADASHQIRRDGNSIAHGDIGDEAISADDAEAIIEFMDALIDEVFQRPAKLQKLKARHDERKQNNGAVTGSVGEARPNVSAGGAEML